MAKPPGDKRSLSFYLRLLIVADGLAIAFLVLLGGVDLQAGPLHLQTSDLDGPVLLLLVLLVAQHVECADGVDETAGLLPLVTLCPALWKYVLDLD